MRDAARVHLCLRRACACPGIVRLKRARAHRFLIAGAPTVLVVRQGGHDAGVDIDRRLGARPGRAAGRLLFFFLLSLKPTALSPSTLRPLHQQCRTSYDALRGSRSIQAVLSHTQVSLVINYDLPNNRELYIHRIGRSGRYGRKGGSAFPRTCSLCLLYAHG